MVQGGFNAGYNVLDTLFEAVWKPYDLFIMQAVSTADAVTC